MRSCDSISFAWWWMSMPSLRSSSPGPPERTSTGTRSENEPATGFTMLCPPPRAVGPEEPVERAAVAHVLAVDGEDDVARLETRLLAGAAGEEPGDDDVVLHGVAEDAEPGARGGRRRAPPEQRVPPVEVVVGGD